MRSPHSLPRLPRQLVDGLAAGDRVLVVCQCPQRAIGERLWLRVESRRGRRLWCVVESEPVLVELAEGVRLAVELRHVVAVDRAVR
jgi:hypothetical protein